jgi:hypothetical protein
LAHQLAELRGRLRPFDVRRGAGPAALGRLEVTAALLPELAGHAPGFVRLGLELDRLLASVAADPAVWPRTLDPFLDDLADFLDDRLATHDRGDDPAAGPGWERQRSFWSRAGAPREIIPVLERDLDLWVGRWPGGQGPVVLSVAGALRREQVRGRLEALGLETVVPAAGDSAAAVAAGIGARAILADDLEPDRSLTRLARHRPGNGDPALVLVSAGECHPGAENARARRLGADGAWCEPWLADDLFRILHHPSHS